MTKTKAKAIFWKGLHLVIMMLSGYALLVLGINAVVRGVSDKPYAELSLMGKMGSWLIGLMLGFGALTLVMLIGEVAWKSAFAYWKAWRRARRYDPNCLIDSKQLVDTQSCPETLDSLTIGLCSLVGGFSLLIATAVVGDCLGGAVQYGMNVVLSGLTLVGVIVAIVVLVIEAVVTVYGIFALAIVAELHNRRYAKNQPLER